VSGSSPHFSPNQVHWGADSERIVLRPSYGSRLAMRGVPMGVIAAQLGHSDTRMTERHYAHLSPSYVAETVRQSFGMLGIVLKTAVTALRRSAES
jgi:hypothetical protein